MSDLSAQAAAEQPDAPDASSRYWLAQIASAQKVYKPWHTRGDKVISRYKDEGTDREITNLTRGRRMALLWSNVETIRPGLYNRTPTPNISRRNKDADPVGRWASIVLERSVEASLASQDFDQTMHDVVQDLLLPGQGIAIEEYGADVEGDEPDEDDATEQAAPTVTNQRSTTRYLHWKDWLTNPARIWAEVWMFSYRSFLTRDEVTKRFGPEIGAAIQLDHKPEQGKTGGPNEQQGDHKATIWTIWSKRHRKVFFVAPGLPEQMLDEMEPPTKHEGFWPFPRPVQATVANDTIIPVPDFALYQDQADAIDLLTQKIYKLSESLRLRGLYPGDMDSIKRLLTDASDTEMIPIENWAMLAERGGANGLVVWFPLKEVAAALVACMEALEKQKAMLYEVTGMGDIIRGASDAGETATAQQLKSQWGSLRIRDRQRDIQRFARDIIRRKSEVIAEHFTLETLQQMSGVQLLTAQAKQAAQMAMQAIQQAEQAAQMAQQQGMPAPPPPGIKPPDPQTMKLLAEPTWEEVMGLLRNDKLRGFTIDVETDSTVEPDQQAEQQKATEFLGSVVSFLEAAAKILPVEPGAAPMLGELLMFGVRRFKAGETIETAIEQFTGAVAQKAQQPKGPDPKVQVEQMKVQTAGVKAQAETTKAQLGVEQAKVEHQQGMQMLDMEMAQANQQHQQAMQQGQQQMAQQAMQPPPGTTP